MDGLSPKDLKGNFDFWSERAGYHPPTPAVPWIEEALQVLPTTHTFGLHGRERPKGYLHRAILFDEQALVSNAGRAMAGDRTTARTVGFNARAVLLDQFVFSYLGVHNPYYARGSFPAFGVFISKPLEEYPLCNCTRRDLAVVTTGEALSTYFLLPEDGRRLAAMEVTHDPQHQGDFWHYWGAEQHWKGKYPTVQWRWMFEFHFRNRVSIHNVDAVLWPHVLSVDPWTLGSAVSEVAEDQARFAQIFPKCTVISYNPSTARPAIAFVRASEKAARHFLKHKAFPRHV